MSDQQEKANRRYLGKVRNQTTKYGVMQKIYMDNLDHTNKDGTPNKYYKGALIWADAETGKNYHIKQMSFWVPREGMDPKLVEKGYSCFITLNLSDEYEVTVLG
jgi:hypothetical protein